jgi:NADH-quinone oxidoreductase subunit C
MATLTPQTVEERLKEKFPGKILGVESPYDFLTLTISHDSIHEIIEFLYKDQEMGFTFLVTCSGMHFPESDLRFAMVYHLQNLPQNIRIRLKAFTNADPPVFPSLTDIFRAADWMERETYDFFGFKFTGHPHLRRILNMDSLEGWPLRKEFPLEDPFRKDKDDKMFGR